MQERTPSERELLEKAARYMPESGTGNVHVDPEHNFVLRNGKGSRVWDVGGREYIDYIMGSGPMVLGHAHPSVVPAVIEAVQEGSTFFASNERAILLAEKISKAVACAEKVRFTTNGSDATFQCLRIARSFRKREKILKFEGAYHGTSDYAMMSFNTSSGNLKDFPQAVPSTAGIPAAIQDLVLTAPYNDAETATAIIERHHDELAAVIVEPAQRILTPKPGFLEAIREVTAHHQIPLIFDEIVTGFRLAYGGAQEYYNVVPDLVAMGKIVGGGYPLAVIAGRDELMSVFDSGRADPSDYIYQVGTLNGSPVACAAGLATLAEMRKEGTYERLYATGRRLKEGLERLFREAEIPIQISGEDSIFGFYITDEPITDYRSTLKGDREMMAKFNLALLEQGVLRSWPDKFYTSLAHTAEDVDKTIEAFSAAVDQLRG